MSMNRLPPLGSLRAFEAAARHLSFTKAAEELGVTQAAVSHQVKTLEESLGTKLFRRLTRALALTDAGSSLAPELGEAFERMTRAVQRVQEREAHGTLRVSLLYTFALAFLVPRLGHFSSRHPAIDLKLETNSRVIDFDREPFDAAIRYGSGPYPSLHTDLLFPDALTPLCAPALARKIKKPADIFNFKLLDDQNFTHVRFSFREGRAFLRPAIGGRRACSAARRRAWGKRANRICPPARPVSAAGRGARI